MKERNVTMGYKTAVPGDIALLKATDFTTNELQNAFIQLIRICAERPKSILEELKVFRKYVPLLIKAFGVQQEALEKSVMQVERSTDIKYDRGNKRWSNEEDEELIDLITQGDMNIHMISTIIGRSPAAIQTRVSNLVGVKRLSQEVAGRFIGKIDGESADAEICGTILKTECK